MSRSKLLLFLLGQIGLMALARFFFQWIIKFASLQTATGTLFAAGTVGAVLLAFRVFDGITDPIAGALSDWWAQRGKKRSQILLYTLLAPGIGLLLCFAPTAEMSEPTRWIFLISGMLLFFLGYTFYGIPFWSLIDEYSAGDDDLRRTLSNLLGAGILVATGIGFVVSPFAVDHLGFRNAALLFAVLGSFGMLGPFFAAPDQAASADISQESTTPAPLHAFISALSQPRFLGLILLLGGSQMSLSIMTSAAPFIAEDLLGGSSKDVALLLGPLLVAAMPCFLYAPSLSRQFGWEKVLVLASALLGSVYCLASFIGTELIYSPFTTAVIIFALGGPMVAVLLALEGEAITDCARADGGKSVSMYFGVYNLVVKGFNGVAIFIAGVFAEMSTASYGAQAIRWMVLSAGASLFLGMGAYLLFARKART